MRASWFSAAAAAVVLSVACRDVVTPPLDQVPTSAEPSPAQAEIPETRGPLGTGWILRSGVPVQVTFEIHEGRAIFEGDIDLGPAEEVPRTAAELSARAVQEAKGAPPASVQSGAVVRSLGQRWPGGRVPYLFAADFPDSMRARVLTAINYLHSQVWGVTLVNAQLGNRGILFGNSTTLCVTEDVGYNDGWPPWQDLNTISLKPTCTWGTALHEILHALGFWHEQSRCDRDTYVEILGNNIVPGPDNQNLAQFAKACEAQGARVVDEYDEGSIMHYPPDAFGIQDSPGVYRITIRSRRGRDSQMGQRDHLSPVDRRTINRLYPPPAPTNVSVSYPAGGPLVSWTAMPGALGYGVDVSIVVTEYDDVGQPIVVYQESGGGVGVTTGSSIVDQSHSYTGMTRCSGYRLTKDYTYAVYAIYPDNGVSPMVRVSAAVASCAPPPPPEEPPPCEGHWEVRPVYDGEGQETGSYENVWVPC